MRKRRARCVPAELSGGYGGGVTPLPIPNREVKPSSADGTARETVWESRSPPGVNRRAPRANGGPFFVCSPEPPSRSISAIPVFRDAGPKAVVTQGRASDRGNFTGFGTSMSAHRILGLEKVPRVRLFAD